MSTVPIHPETVPGEPSVLRWIMPAETLPFVGRVAAAPPSLHSAIDDGTISRIDVEPTSVRITLSDDASWRRDGERIRTALLISLDEPGQWSPVERSSADDVLRMATVDVIDGDVGDYIRSHGGVIEILDVADGRVELSLTGACTHCPASDVTLTSRVEAAVRQRFPQVREVKGRTGPPIAAGRRLLGIIPRRDLR